MAGGFYNLSFLTGGIFTVAAAIMYIFPPKKINSFYGYRTPASMKSQERWTFSQRFSAIAMLQSGLGLLAVSGLGFWSPFSPSVNNTLAWTALIAAVILMLYRTEKAIKAKFPVYSTIKKAR